MADPGFPRWALTSPSGTPPGPSEHVLDSGRMPVSRFQSPLALQGITTRIRSAGSAGGGRPGSPDASSPPPGIISGRVGEEKPRSKAPILSDRSPAVLSAYAACLILLAAPAMPILSAISFASFPLLVLLVRNRIVDVLQRRH